jgi:ADP-ribose pyrophosphatase YjhB (NUDIX family)
MLYDLLKICVSIFFNILNILMGGRLPPFGTASVIVENEGRYLVVELPRGRTVFPGGFMNWQEQPAQTAEREGREETGLQLRTRDLIGVYTRNTRRLTQMSNISFVYSAEVVGGKLRKTVEGRPRWLREDELRQHMDTGSLRLLDDYLSKQNRQTSLT